MEVWAGLATGATDTLWPASDPANSRSAFRAAHQQQAMDTGLADKGLDLAPSCHSLDVSPRVPRPSQVDSRLCLLCDLQGLLWRCRPLSRGHPHSGSAWCSLPMDCAFSAVLWHPPGVSSQRALNVTVSCDLTLTLMSWLRWCQPGVSTVTYCCPLCNQEVLEGGWTRL